ncbi:biotin-independent malonate decarboxylase subunit gamma [Dyella sp.]|uniref:biotin-independent malonate decarboxylase subunit gamma n=1 Tax=Dyella sp. TaxID=1869338 RepID=UPI002ED2702A
MMLDDILASLFPGGHAISREGGMLHGQAALVSGQVIQVIGVSDRTAVGVDEAVLLAGKVLAVVDRGDRTPILVLIDSDSQRMSKRDELLGLNECLAHLAKCLILADTLDHPTIGLLYGYTAAGAFIATALATRTLVALPGAEPAVMDLPSMARVTKLPLEVLQEKSRTTAVFAPGLANLTQTGAVAGTFDPARSLSEQLSDVLRQSTTGSDRRDQWGKQRGGRPKAADIAERVYGLARAGL